MNKNKIVETHSITDDEIEEFLSLASQLTKDCVQLDYIADVNEHKRLLSRLADQTNIPKPVLEYILFGISTSYR